MELTLEHEAMAETYQDIEPMLIKLAGRWIREFGGDFEEIMSNLAERFCWAWHHHDASRSQFSTYVYYLCIKQLKETQRRYARRAKKCHVLFTDPNRIDKYEKQRPLIDLLDELSQDSLIIVELLFDYPGEDIPANKKGMCQFLYGLGWSKNRIVSAFQEIQEAMKV